MEKDWYGVGYGLLLLFLMYTVNKLVVLVWWKPLKIQKQFQDQGIGGLPYRPLIGNIGELVSIYWKARGGPPPPPPSEANPHHTTLQLVLPHLHVWRKKYGRVFLYWFGCSPRLSITDPELIKEFTINPREYDQAIQHPVVHTLLGKSITATGGDTWATQRRLLNPLFLSESLKGLSGLIQLGVKEKMETWTSLMESNELEINVLKEFEGLAQHIIARVIYGEDAKEGLPIVQLQSEQAMLASQSIKTIYIPGSRFLPTSYNRRSKWLRREIERRLNELIMRRVQSSNAQKGNDWLAWIISSNTMSQQHKIDECSAMGLAGSETTSLLLAWACVLLSIHTKWQDKAREEIHQFFKGNLPATETLSHLKILNMVINETMRLYPQVPFVMKRARNDTRFGGLTIPAGTEVEVPIIAVLHDPQQWGENVDQFDPARFSEGISRASKHPMAFMPFMQGPRICIGMNFAMMEARIALAMILNSFRLTLSPNYKHEPDFGLTLTPGNNTYVIFHKV